MTETGFVSKTSRLADLNLEVIATHGPTETRTTPTKPAVPAAKLRVIRGLRLSAEFQLYEGSNLIGRRDDRPVDVDVSDLEPPDRIWASRHHAMITVNNGLMIIEDLNSMNGTFVNRQRVYPGHKRSLVINDVVQIGTIQFKVTT